MGLGGGIGLGLTGMTTHAALIADAYVRRRGLATGIAFGGSMAAYALAAPAQWIITNWGWRPAFWCYAAAILALIPWVWRVHPTRLPSAADRGATAPAAISPSTSAPSPSPSSASPPSPSSPSPPERAVPRAASRPSGGVRSRGAGGRPLTTTRFLAFLPRGVPNPGA